MIASPERTAEQATFQSFANCYLREVDGGSRVRHAGSPGAGADCIECALPACRAFLRLELVSPSLCGPHRFGASFMKRAFETEWRRIEPLAAVQALLAEAYRDVGAGHGRSLRGCELELLARILDSYQTTALYLASARPEASRDDRFIAAEQSLAYGHWLHPTPKSRQGMTRWQQPAYAPELEGSFQLVWFAADASLLRHDSAVAESAPDVAAGLLGDDRGRFEIAPGEAILPMHPLQAEALSLEPHIRDLIADGRLRPLGPAGPDFTATSSVRTVYSPRAGWMLKFSLPVRITNSVRRNRRHELEAGVAMARLFDRTDFLERHPRFRVLHDPAYLTLDLPGRAESGFETILRRNPFTDGADHGAMTIAALTADPLPGERSRLGRIIRDLSDAEGAALDDVATRWFSAYLDCALDPLLALYDELGVALEAHQQNSVLDVSSGYPTRYYYRDAQGYYLSNAYRGALRRLAPETERVAHLYYDDARIQDPFAYYLVVNQIFSVVARMGHDGLAPEAGLLAVLRARLDALSRSLTSAGADFARGLIGRPTIAAKANLVTRLLDIDELEGGDETAKYRRLPNPLFSARADLSGDGYAVAV